jgi:Mg-chelatase subunit ChlD
MVTTDVTIILDSSGSMLTRAESVIEGFNSFLTEQKALEGEAFLTLITFASAAQVVYEGEPIAQVSKLTAETYAPDGWTAMNDAIAFGISRANQRQAARVAAGESPASVVIVVFTDGQENTSKEFSGAKGLNIVRGMVQEAEAKGWNFLFLGAELSAVDLANNYAGSTKYAGQVASGSAGVLRSYAQVSSLVGGTRMGLSDLELQARWVGDPGDLATSTLGYVTPTTTTNANGSK